MKKINSNGYGGRVLLIGSGVLAVGVLLRYIPLMPTVVPVIVMSIGAVIFLGFALLLTIELWQDRRINKQYAAIQTTKIRLPNGMFECQACGNTNVREDDDVCRICGNQFT